MQEIRFSSRAKLAVVLTLVALGLLLLYLARTVISPFIWAFIAAYVLDPVIEWLQRRTRLSRLLVVAAFYLLFLVSFGLFLRVLIPGVQHEILQLRANLPQMASTLEVQATGGQAPSILGYQLDPHVVASTLQRATTEVNRWIGENALGIGMQVLEYAIKTLVFLVATFYLLLQWDRIGQDIARLTPRAYRAELGQLVEEIDAVLGLYLRGLVILVALMSGVTYVVLVLLGLHYALVVALLTGFLELIPFIGPITAGTVAVTIGVVEGNPFGWSPITYAGVLALVYLVLRNLEDYLVIPHVVGHAVRVHPLIILFSVLVATNVFGVSGAVLAAPSVGVLRVVLAWLYRKLMEPEQPETVEAVEETGPAPREAPVAQAPPRAATRPETAPGQSR